MCKPGPHALPLTIPDSVRGELEAMSRSTTLSHVLVQRARIVLAGAEGKGTDFIALQVGCEAWTVRKWKRRFRERPQVEALDDLPRSGRPAKVSVATRCQVVALACERPDEKLTPFRDTWTHKALAAATLALTGVLLSVSEIGRILHFNNLRPHLVRYWLTTKDPDFGPKAERLCDLYLNPPPGAHVYCVDEKPIQVLGRKYPMLIAKDGVVRKEYEYIRRGTCCLIAAFEVCTGKVIGEVVDHRTADKTVAFLEKLAKHQPTGDIYIVWDNLNTHYDGPDKRWTRFNERHGNRFHFVHTPIHASWLNQVEIWFSILEKRVLKHADFADVAAASERVMGYIDLWTAQLAHPFRWTWRYIKPEDRARKAA
jgi:transposase